MMKTEQQKIPDNPICKECGFEIPVLSKFLMHKDGTILCVECFTKLKKKGAIK